MNSARRRTSGTTGGPRRLLAGGMERDSRGPNGPSLMNPGDAPAEPAGTDPALTTDLRHRLQGSQAQQTATRTEAHQLARELALTRRLLRFALDGSPPVRRAPPAIPGVSRRAVKLTEPVRFHLDACERQGAHTVVSGWAFRPRPEWDAQAATLTLLFRAEADTYAAAAGQTPRPDVAAHFAHAARRGRRRRPGAGRRGVFSARSPTIPCPPG